MLKSKSFLVPAFSSVRYLMVEDTMRTTSTYFWRWNPEFRSIRKLTATPFLLH